ncbi:MAG: NADPH-dependent assimilatory sulfite reductase hemoprotein subunit [Gammaproteobacteria bacterium]|nr:NADPH-dependent assimilatory sulfite reductase hemoprotein subunit [Gammaproteobacteria bacterium]
MSESEVSNVERIKAASRHLRGTLAKGLVEPLTGAISDADTQLSKFHGIYQQDNRDIRNERKRQKLEPAYSFMVRARIPGGMLTASQWLAMDQIANEYANESIRLTTRQAIQFHGVIKRELKQTIAAINQSTIDTIAACGDVNRNVMAPPLPALSSVHRQVQRHAESLSGHLMPASRAYHEIWLDGKKIESSNTEIEPIYGDTYLPRKFKSAFVVPPRNDVDVFSQDLGFITIVKGGEIKGFNVTVGGGMGMTHGDNATYPRLGDVFGFCRPEHVLAVAEAVVTTQRDFGDRSDRKHARLKYTIDDRGIDWFRSEVEKRSGVLFEAPKNYSFAGNGDVYGWQLDDVGAWHYTLFVQSGRVVDSGERQLLSGMRAIAETVKCEIRLTPNQNLIISKIAANDKDVISDLLVQFGIENSAQATPLRLNSMACVAFPTCGLAMAESERYLPTLIDKLDAQLESFGLQDDPITIRMTGCANGCARPYIAEIGLVGKGPGRYSLFLGAGFAGDRLASKFLDNADEREILSALAPLLQSYAQDRQQDENFGDFLVRRAVVPNVSTARHIHEG